MNYGQKTVKFASGLWKKLPKGYTVYCDHGKTSDPFVCTCKGVIGKTLSNKTKIADFDIVIIKDNKIKMIIEIEETGTLSPKKIFGDYFAFGFTHSIFLKDNKYIPIHHSTIRLIAGTINEKGNSNDKIESIVRKIKATCKLSPDIQIIKCDKNEDLFKELDKIVLSNCT